MPASPDRGLEPIVAAVRSTACSSSSAAFNRSVSHDMATGWGAMCSTDGWAQLGSPDVAAPA